MAMNTPLLLALSLILLAVGSPLFVQVKALPMDQQQQTKFTLCGERFKGMMNKVCTVSTEPNSCLKSEVRVEDRVRANCCQNGCSLEEIKELCCFTDACLAQCYPGKNYKMGGVF